MSQNGNTNAARNRLLAWIDGVEPQRCVAAAVGPEDELRFRLNQIAVGAAETLDAMSKNKEEFEEQLNEAWHQLQKLVIATTSTLAWVQEECQGHRDPPPPSNRQMEQMLKIPTKYSKFLRRVPGETVAVCSAMSCDGVKLSTTATYDDWKSPSMWMSGNTALIRKS